MLFTISWSNPITPHPPTHTPKKHGRSNPFTQHPLPAHLWNMRSQTALHATSSLHPPETCAVKLLYTPHPHCTPLKHAQSNYFTRHTLAAPPWNMRSQTALHATPLLTPPELWASGISWSNPFTHHTLPTPPPPPPETWAIKPLYTPPQHPPPPPRNMGRQTALHITPSPPHPTKMGFGISQTNPFTHHTLPTHPETWAFDISRAYPFTHYTLPAPHEMWAFGQSVKALYTPHHPHESWAFGISQSNPIIFPKRQSLWKQFICPHIPIFWAFNLLLFWGGRGREGEGRGQCLEILSQFSVANYVLYIPPPLPSPPPLQV